MGIIYYGMIECQVAFLWDLFEKEHTAKGMCVIGM